MAKDLSFWAHLDELRVVLVKSLCLWGVATVCAFCFKEPLFDILFAPSQPDFFLYRGLCYLARITGWSVLCRESVHVAFINTELTAQFMTHLQVSMFAGLTIALPFIVYWIYGFVSPALYACERRYGVALVLLSFGLFALGVGLNYALIFPFSFRFLGTYQVSSFVVNQISLSSYVSLFLVLSVLLGLLFEVPVLTWFLSRMGILRREHLRQYRRHVFVLILILAAVITPTGDPFTLLLVTAPVYLLYELSIAIIR